MFKHLTIAALAALMAGPALAASDAAWEEFAASVEAACLAATGDILTGASAIVDPFGSQSYGLAVVTGEAAPGANRSIICVVDKQTLTAEIGGELEITVSPVAATQP